MALMRVYQHGDHVLTYDTDDVEDCRVQTPNDVIDVTPPDATAVHRKLGQAHLLLSVHFKPGKRALWVDAADLETKE